MSAIMFNAATYANASTAGVTKPDLSRPGLGAGVDVVDAARRVVAGAISPLESWLGGGIHPETAVGTAPVLEVERATDSVVGRLGGLVPRPGSTVAPGPAGGAAVGRSTWAKGLRGLMRLRGAAQGGPGSGDLNGGNGPIVGAQVPARPDGGPIPRDPGLPIGFG